MVVTQVDPRIERSRELVLAATIELLGEIGYGSLAIEAVAARSGVAKSTIYRHWSGKDELVAQAFARLREEDSGAPLPGPVRQGVIAALHELAAAVHEPDWNIASCIPALIDGAARHAEVARECARQAEERARPLVLVLEEGIKQGELPAGTDASVLADALVGPILLRGIFHRSPLAPDEVPALVDMILPETG